MDLRINLKGYKYVLLGIAAISTLIACHPDDSVEGNGLSDPNVDSSFTITPVEGATNRYLLESQSNGVLASKWDLGEGVYMGKMTETVFLPDAGTYTITHTAVGRGGSSTSTSQELVVQESDPVAGNLVQGGKLDTADDIAEWTILNIGDPGASWTFHDGMATINSDGSYHQQGIYQTIEVVKDKEYTIDMNVSGGTFGNTWFEVYAGTTPPVPGSDYTDNKVMGLSTWDGCATAPFSGKLSSVGCVVNTRTETLSNVVKFDTSGTIYLVIRSGGEFYDPAGISVDNIEFRGHSN
jgi:hypothetical protein